MASRFCLHSSLRAGVIPGKGSAGWLNDARWGNISGCRYVTTVKAVTQLGSSASSLIESAIHDPGSLNPVLSQVAATSGSGLDGRGLATLAATACLAENWHADAFRALLSERALRSRPFTDSELILLHHVLVSLHVHGAAKMSGEGGPVGAVPFDIADACRRAFEAEGLRSQPLYDLVANVLRRNGYKYSHRTTHLGTGYVLPLCIAVPSTSRLVALSIDGPYNCLPGTEEPSLASRLWEANLRHCGTPVMRIRPSESDRVMGRDRIDTRSFEATAQAQVQGAASYSALRQSFTAKPKLGNPMLAKLMRGRTRAPDLGFSQSLGGGPGGPRTTAQMAAVARERAETLDQLVAAILAQLDSGPC